MYASSGDCVGVSDNHLAALCLCLMPSMLTHMELLANVKANRHIRYHDVYNIYNISNNSTTSAHNNPRAKRYAKQKAQAAVLQLKILCSERNRKIEQIPAIVSVHFCFCRGFSFQTKRREDENLLEFGS